MIFLPIVQRELRVRSRRPETFRVRALSAMAAAGIGAISLLGSTAAGGVQNTNGPWLFSLLVWVNFGLALLSGPLLTADCVSREVREGTLGLLFLTDLNGVDVVAGKFTALALLPLHALLATLPVIFMCVFMGGVTFAEFWRCLLVLMNTLFLSMALGMAVSAWFRNGQQAIATTVGALVMLSLLPELLSWVIESHLGQASWPWLRSLSPLETMLRAFADGYVLAPRRFWYSLIAQHAFGWCLLLFAAYIVRTSWREGTRPSPSGEAAAWRKWWPTGDWLFRHRTSADHGSPAWYGWRGSWILQGVWWVVGLTAAVALGVFAFTATGKRPSNEDASSTMVITYGFCALKFLVAAHAAYSLHNAYRSGAMELLLITPVTSMKLCEGHLRVMRRAVTWPVIILGMLEISLAVAANAFSAGGPMILMAAGPAVLDVAVHALDLVAVAYWASWYALRDDHPAKTLLRATCALIALPVIACGYGRVFIDILAIGHARAQLERFRELAHAWFFPGAMGKEFGRPRTT